MSGKGKARAKGTSGGKAAPKPAGPWMLTRNHKGRQAGQTFTRGELKALGIDPDQVEPGRDASVLVVPVGDAAEALPVLYTGGGGALGHEVPLPEDRRSERDRLRRHFGTAF